MSQGAPRPILENESLSPKHHQLYLVLVQQIRDGVYSAEDPIPSEIELGRQFGVSRVTVRKALDRLEREKLITRQRGRGTFVRQDSPGVHVAASLSGSIENLIAMGLQTEVRVLSLDYVPAPAGVARAMGLAPGEIVQRAVRVRAHDGVPFSHLTTHVPEDIGRSFDREALASQPLLMLLVQAGVEVKSAEQTITAKLATPEISRLLDTQPGAPLLSITRLVRDAQGRAVEHIHGLYRPDTYEHQMSFDHDAAEAIGLWQT